MEEWVKNRPLVVKEVHPACRFDVSEDQRAMVCTLVYTVVYQLREGYTHRSMPRPGTLPFWAKRVPCMEAIDELTGRAVMVMAGIFGVPEGAPLDRDDNEPAPSPLLSPDFVLVQYGELFKPHERSEEEREHDTAILVGSKEEIPLPGYTKVR